VFYALFAGAGDSSGGSSGPSAWIDRLINAIVNFAPDGNFFSNPWNVHALFALVLVALCCGSVGALVVGGRMAFLSDGLAHSSLAGVSIGFVLFQVFLAGHRPGTEFWSWVTPTMIVFGLLVGVAIVSVRERTGLSTDVVIGIVFAASAGLAATLRKIFANRALFGLEDFLFGQPGLASPGELLALICVTVLTLIFLVWGYNLLLLSAFNHSLALSRRVPVRLVNYLFVALLAVLVNLCLRIVGAMLIGALLVVPAATAMNVSRNLRQLFTWTLILSLLVCMLGLFIPTFINDAAYRAGSRAEIGVPGTIVMLSVFLFCVSMLVGPWWRARRPTAMRPTA
jgi:zinc transport system permease protein